MSSIFTSRVTQTIDIPGAPGETATIRKLSPKQLHQAQQAQQAQAMADLQALGGMKVLGEIIGTAKKDADAPADAAKRDPMLTFDRVTLLVRGITNWTLPEARTVESFEDLDEATADALAQAVLQLARPDLFQSAEEAEAARKNG